VPPHTPHTSVAPAAQQLPSAAMLALLPAAEAQHEPSGSSAPRQHAFVLSSTPAHEGGESHTKPPKPPLHVHAPAAQEPWPEHVWPAHGSHKAMLHAVVVAGLPVAPNMRQVSAVALLLSEAAHATVRVSVPPPHVLVHVLHAPMLQPYVTHARLLHARSVAGFAAVHCASATVVEAPVVHGATRVAFPTTPSLPVHALLHGPQAPGCHRKVAQAAGLHACATAPSVVPLPLAAQWLFATALPSLRRHDARRRRVPPPHAALQPPQRLYAYL